MKKVGVGALLTIPVLLAGCGSSDSSVPRSRATVSSVGLQAAHPERPDIGTGQGSGLKQDVMAIAPAKPAAPDEKPDPFRPKIKLVSETVSLPGRRRHTLRSCLLSGRADGINYLEISPNGRYVVLGLLVKGPDGFPNWRPGPECGRVFVIDQREGKFLKTLIAGRNFYRNYYCGVVFSPNCSHLASILHDHEIEVLGIGSGAKPIRLEAAKGPAPKWVRWSPDGSLLACRREDREADRTRSFVDVWDGKTGKKLFRFEGWRFAFPSDGKTILIESNPYRLWDVRTGKMIGQGKSGDLCDIRDPETEKTAQVRIADISDGVRVRCSPAGRLAIFKRNPDFPYRVKEENGGATVALVARRSGKELLTVASPEPGWPKHWSVPYPNPLAANFPSEQFLVARARCSPEAADGGQFSYQIWDLSGLPGEKVDGAVMHPQLSREELENAWAALADDEGYPAREAMGKLLGAPAQLAAFLNTRVKPVPALPKGQIKQWVADLDSRRFRTRQAAEHSLTEHADLALPELERRLADKKNLPLELRRRAAGIVDRIRNEPVAGETGRMLWVVELLELWGTPEAKKLLKRFAAGALDAWVTLEAKASLEVLDRKK